MHLRFKVQKHQTDAVDAVVDCFAGQPRSEGVSYRIDSRHRAESAQTSLDDVPPADAGLRNAEITLDAAQLLDNVHAVQRRGNLPLAEKLLDSPAGPGAPNLDVEMETGTGKTYVYIKTMMELRQRYGWSRFIVVVPSIAIREGVKASFDLTAEHFQQLYGTKPRAFVYDSSRLHELESFSSDAGVQVMIINVQAFNATGKDQRRIYDELDEFRSRRPIDVIRANRPIVIIDEPQKIGAPKSLAALARFNALMVLRYSATHQQDHVKVHRLDALDAYREKLVKKIAVRGITVKGLAGTTAYLYLDAIEIAQDSGPRARVEIEVQTRAGPIKRVVKRLAAGANLHDVSGGIEAYRGLFVREIDAGRDLIELSNGDEVVAGQLADRDVTETTKRRLQIREVIAAHLDKERELFARGVKVLSLFFIDEVAKYRDYQRDDTLGEYARVFEEEYASVVEDVLGELPRDRATRAYQEYLRRDAVRQVHQGYFAVDKHARLVDPKVAGRGDEKGQAVDAGVYDLILRDKERLLSLDEPVRFLFSHSALREGWDNPNVFVMGMLKKSDNTISRRQEIGRGLRIAVDQHGDRLDDPLTVHEINELTVVTDESYGDFVAGLQREYLDLPLPEDGRKPKRIPLNTENFEKREFQELGNRISHKTVYRVEFDSDELIGKCVHALDTSLHVAPLQYVVHAGAQLEHVDANDVEQGTSFAVTSTATHTESTTVASQVRYDLLGEIAERTTLTRKTASAILQGVSSVTFAKYRRNPEQFISEAARLINEQKASVIVER